MVSGYIWALGVSHKREGIISLLNDKFFYCFIRHRQSVNFNPRHFFFDNINKIRVSYVFNITNTNVCFRTLAYFKHFVSQFFIPHSSANECCVHNDVFNKAVSCTSDNLFCIRFLRHSARVAPDVNNKCVIFTFDNDCHKSRQHLIHCFIKCFNF